MIKLITIDLDGTLFDDVKNISKENKLAIEKCHNLGIKVVVATGRPMKGVRPVLEELGLTTDNDYVIIYNGAKILNVGKMEVIFSTYITGKTVKDIYDESKRLKVNIHAFREDGTLITPKLNPYTDVEATINHLDTQVFDFNNIIVDIITIKVGHFFYKNLSMIY